ncbi:MAG TPA: NADPH-dependent FMN reductase [Steroidobacteraceae bacterium]
MNILALSGSLRRDSINSAFCRATAVLAPPNVRVQVYSGLGEVPLFNPDLESSPPPAVTLLRTAIRDTDAVVIASPEYAHGISGVMKNALDWLVSSEPTVRKPVALVNTAPRAHHAHDALREILTTMSVDIVGSASVTVPLLGTWTTEVEMVSSPQVSRTIRDMVAALALHIEGRDASGASFPL